MKSPHAFIVRPMKGRRYDNIKEIGGVDFITSVSKEDHKASNRFAEVVSTPLDYKGEIEQGDVLLVHHNVFKFYFDMYGREKSGKSFFKDDLFFIDPDQFFLYNKKGKWCGYDKYCFVKPIPKKDFYLKKFGAKEEPLYGKIKYSNKQLEKLGVKEGDEISFTPHSEYEFNIEGEKLYRMFTDNITMVV
jgi:hypothetical protein